MGLGEIAAKSVLGSSASRVDCPRPDSLAFDGALVHLL